MNVNEHDNDGNTPLHRAITRGDLASVNTLLAVGAEIDHPGNHSQTPLMTATRLGKVEMVQRLARTANVSYPDVNGTTPLGHAIAARNVDVTRALLAACAPLDELDSSHASADVLLSRGFFREQQTAQIRQLVEARRNNPRCR